MPLPGLPSLPPISDKKAAAYERWFKILMLLATACGSMWTGVTVLWGTVADVTTATKLGNAIFEHDKKSDAHKAVRQDFAERLQELAKQNMALAAEIRALRSEAVELGAGVVSLTAADAEPDRRLKGLAAAHYREQFRKLVQRGYSIDDAKDAVFRTPWPNKPH